MSYSEALRHPVLPQARLHTPVSHHATVSPSGLALQRPPTSCVEVRLVVCTGSMSPMLPLWRGWAHLPTVPILRARTAWLFCKLSATPRNRIICYSAACILVILAPIMLSITVVISTALHTYPAWCTDVHPARASKTDCSNHSVQGHSDWTYSRPPIDAHEKRQYIDIT